MTAIRKEAVDLVMPRAGGGLLRGGTPVPVTSRSPRALGKAVYRLAQFFRREFRYDFVQYGYEGRDADPTHRAFLWPHPEAGWCGDAFEVPLVGACCFRWRDDWPGVAPGHALQWVWFHPYHRRQGLLSEAWPAFREQFGNFVTEPPLSAAMKAFLAKRGECLKCGRGPCSCRGSGGTAVCLEERT
jgi:hypothetical protein